MKTMLCLDHLGYSYQNYELFNSINDIVETKAEEISLVPLNASRPFMNINTAVYNVGEMSSFNNGLLICSNIRHVKKILSCSTNTTKLLYIYDMDWMYGQMLFDDIYDVLSNKKIKIMVRSTDFLDPISCITTRKPDAVVEHFDLEKIWNSL